MLLMFVVGVPVALAAGIVLSRRVAPDSVQALAAMFGTIAAALGWLLLGWTVLGPTYVESTVTLRSGGTAGQPTVRHRSLLEVGISDLTIAMIAVEVVCFGFVLLGGLAAWRGFGRARWMMLAGTIPLVAIGLVSWGLAAVGPAVILASFATTLAFVGLRIPSPP